MEERNLAVVAAHMAGEARDPAGILPLYADDIVFEVPTRSIVLRDKVAIEANYRSMFASVAGLALETLSRTASGDRVEDLSTLRFRLVGDGFLGAPVSPGARVALTLHHEFVLRDGLIVRETVREDWQAL